MNVLGHSYVAARAIDGDSQLLIIGALLPESFPFIHNNPFGQNEIHEGGEVLLEYLRQNSPDKVDLAFGMLAHSVKFGADKLNKEIEHLIPDQHQELVEEIALASGLTDKRIGGYRLHNFLWWGMDTLLLRHRPDFVRQVSVVIGSVDILELADILSKCFHKNFFAANTTMETLFRTIYQPQDLQTVEGLARTWARQAAGLPEHDDVDIILATKLFEKCAKILERDWQDILSNAVAFVRGNLEYMLSSTSAMVDCIAFSSEE